MHDVASLVALYLPGVQAVQIPSSTVDPRNVVTSFAEGLLKAVPVGHEVLVMFLHSVDVRAYCPAGHMKTQQMPFLMVLPGEQGAEVLPEVRERHLCPALASAFFGR